ncbi:hypothetical protein [Hymenobacter sedentarius]|uniref:hypothetical protein n=1 Tax=Hymenobacter sedentarius TaxID=1411621 RepID=UPI000A7EEB26|nr:hypothetical protein [Hymenobacter sedentarius]
MTERPSSIQERKDLANPLTPPVFKVSSEGHLLLSPAYLKSAPGPYNLRFPSYLVTKLRKWSPEDVADNLQQHFPDCDVLDCNLLDGLVGNLLSEKRWAADRQGNRIEPGAGKRFIANVAKVNKWIKDQRQRLTKAEEAQNSHITATAPFSGSVSSLALALYILERRGVISLLAYRKNKGNMAALCRTLCHVFPPQNTSSKAPSLALELALSKIPIEKLGVGELDFLVFAGLGKKNQYHHINSLVDGSSNIELSLPIELLPKALRPA